MRQWNHLVAQAYVEPFVILTILILNAVIAIWQVLSLGVLWWKGVSEVSEPVTICLIRYAISLHFFLSRLILNFSPRLCANVSMSIGSLTHMGTQGHLCRSCHGSPLAKFPHRSELQDSKAEKALDALKKLAPECAMVLRNGNWQSTLGCSGCVKVCLWKHRCEMKWGGSLSQTPGNCTLALLA